MFLSLFDKFSAVCPAVLALPAMLTPLRAVKIEAGREARAGDVLHRHRVLMIDASGIAEQGQLDEGAVASAEIDVSADEEDVTLRNARIEHLLALRDEKHPATAGRIGDLDDLAGLVVDPAGADSTTDICDRRRREELTVPRVGRADLLEDRTEEALALLLDRKSVV